MNAPKRQIAALSRAVSRRQRFEQDLRAQLAQRIAARVPLVEQEQRANEYAAALEAEVLSYRHRITAMMTGAVVSGPLALLAFAALLARRIAVEEQALGVSTR